MNENQDRQNNLIDTTDCLEAVGVFRGWKNFLFVIVICCLLLLQISFWLVDTGLVKANGAEDKSPTVAAEVVEKTNEVEKREADDKKQISKTTKKVTEGPNQLTEAALQQSQKKHILLGFSLTFKQLAWLIRFLNFVLIPIASLYCLTMLFILKVSMLGRLGGINHICRAFFLSLTFLVLLLPWQRFFAGIVVGAIYTPGELVRWYTVETTGGIFGIIFYYLRFTGYWLLVMLLLIFSQLRSARWAKAILRRLEVI